MKWEGSAIRKSAEAQGLSLADLARQVGVSRQAVNDWIGGQIPKGLFLITLCDILNLEPDELFLKETDNTVQMPVYRTKRKLTVSLEQQEKMRELAENYKRVFRQNSVAKIQSSIAISELNPENALKIADQLRNIAHVPADKPLDYGHIFDLLNRLNIYAIFCEFPVTKLYAFFTRIYHHRVIFVDVKTNLMDLIFPLLHETVHSILRDNKTMIIDDAEEEFCDLVANYAQFPDKYIQEIYGLIQSVKPGVQINILKQYSQSNHHAICGVVKRIQEGSLDFDLKYGGADSNLRRGFPLIENILQASDNVRNYIHAYRALSPLFINLIMDQVEELSPRILGELFSLDNYSDMVSLKDELLQVKSVGAEAER